MGKRLESPSLEVIFLKLRFTRRRRGVKTNFVLLQIDRSNFTHHFATWCMHIGKSKKAYMRKKYIKREYIKRIIALEEWWWFKRAPCFEISYGFGKFKSIMYPHYVSKLFSISLINILTILTFLSSNVSFCHGYKENEPSAKLSYPIFIK